jgi:methionyl-tRNA formyltransferase
MKILYITRHFNHSGYLILERLLKENVEISAVLLHKNNDPLKNKMFRMSYEFLYNLTCKFYRSKKVKTFHSEEQLAKKNNIPIIWTHSIKSDEFFEDLVQLSPDIIVMGGGWHELLPQRVFSFPELGCINTHPSLLPEFRGTSITRWQVLYGLKKSGSTIHYVDDNFDTGGVLAQKEFHLNRDYTPQELFFELGKVGADIMVELLERFRKKGKQTSYFVEHNKDFYQYFKKWTWDMDVLKINWSKSFEEINSFVWSNYQENFKYAGPVFAFDKKKYILRESSIKQLESEDFQTLDRLQEGKIYALIKEENLILYRRNEKSALIIKQVQQFDRFFKYRRANNPIRFIEKSKTNFIETKLI